MERVYKLKESRKRTLDLTLSKSEVRTGWTLQILVLKTKVVIPRLQAHQTSIICHQGNQRWSQLITSYKVLRNKARRWLKNQISKTFKYYQPLSQKWSPILRKPLVKWEVKVYLNNRARALLIFHSYLMEFMMKQARLQLGFLLLSKRVVSQTPSMIVRTLCRLDLWMLILKGRLSKRKQLSWLLNISKNYPNARSQPHLKFHASSTLSTNTIRMKSLRKIRKKIIYSCFQFTWDRTLKWFLNQIVKRPVHSISMIRTTTYMPPNHCRLKWKLHSLTRSKVSQRCLDWAKVNFFKSLLRKLNHNHWLDFKAESFSSSHLCRESKSLSHQFKIKG